MNVGCSVQVERDEAGDVSSLRINGVENALAAIVAVYGLYLFYRWLFSDS